MSSFGNFVDEAGVTRLRATGGGGGGSQPVKVVRFPFSFNTPNLKDGVAVYTPAAGDVILADSTLSITTGWDGTTPSLDLGDVADGRALLFGTGIGNADSAVGDMGTMPSTFLSLGATGTGNLVCAGGTPILLAVNAGTQGVDPGASRGQGQLILLIIPGP